MGWNKNPSFVQTQINAATIKISSDQNINDDSFRRLSTVAPPFLRYDSLALIFLVMRYNFKYRMP